MGIWSTIKKVAGAAGSVLDVAGAGMGLFGSKPKTTSTYDQIHGQLDYETLKSKKFGEWAKNMGVSRYALLGNMGQGAQLSPVSSGGRGQQVGRDMQRMGQSISRGLQTELTRKNLQADLRIKEAQAKGLEIDIANKLAEQTQEPNIAKPPGRVEVVPAKIEASSPTHGGIRAGAMPGKNVYLDEHNFVDIAYNQELAEALESQGYTESIMRQIYEYAQGMKVTLQSRKARKPLKEAIERELRRVNKIKNNQYVVYDYFWGKFKVVDRPTKSQKRIRQAHPRYSPRYQR